MNNTFRSSGCGKIFSITQETNCTCAQNRFGVASICRPCVFYKHRRLCVFYKHTNQINGTAVKCLFQTQQWRTSRSCKLVLYAERCCHSAVIKETFFRKLKQKVCPHSGSQFDPAHANKFDLVVIERDASLHHNFCTHYQDRNCKTLVYIKYS